MIYNEVYHKNFKGGTMPSGEIIVDVDVVVVKGY